MTCASWLWVLEAYTILNLAGGGPGPPAAPPMGPAPGPQPPPGGGAVPFTRAWMSASMPLLKAGPELLSAFVVVLSERAH